MAAPNNVFAKLRDDAKPLESRVQDSLAATLTPIATRLNATPLMGARPPSWVRPDIISTSGYAQAPSIPATPLPLTAYHKDALGYVHGKVALLTSAGAGANTVAFNIAKGWRPEDLLPFLGSDGGGVVWSVYITPDGNFNVVSALAAGDILVLTFDYLAAS